MPAEAAAVAPTPLAVQPTAYAPVSVSVARLDGLVATEEELGDVGLPADDELTGGAPACPRCGAPLGASRLCPRCDAVSAGGAPTRCPACGVLGRAGAERCPACGQRLGP